MEYTRGQLFKSEHFTIRLIGASRDGRTNQWGFTCNCGAKEFTPSTTMLRTQYVSCPKCQVGEAIDYNDLKPLKLN